MVRLEFFVVAESFSIDQLTNRVSIFNILETIQAPAFPLVLPQLMAVSLWEDDERDTERQYQVDIRITLGDTELEHIQQNLKFPRPRLRTIAQILNLKIPGSGRMKIELKLNGEHKAWHYVDVNQAPN
ncbi:MAG: hypothetical protein IID37_01085 [Planctomycetes bacterium]|nr:hypothetical protein [Planctomycetota bacterium]